MASLFIMFYICASKLSGHVGQRSWWGILARPMADHQWKSPSSAWGGRGLSLGSRGQKGLGRATAIAGRMPLHWGTNDPRLAQILFLSFHIYLFCHYIININYVCLVYILHACHDVLVSYLKKEKEKTWQDYVWIKDWSFSATKDVGRKWGTCSRRFWRGLRGYLGPSFAKLCLILDKRCRAVPPTPLQESTPRQLICAFPEWWGVGVHGAISFLGGVVVVSVLFVICYLWLLLFLSLSLSLLLLLLFLLLGAVSILTVCAFLSGSVLGMLRGIHVGGVILCKIFDVFSVFWCKSHFCFALKIHSWLKNEVAWM